MQPRRVSDQNLKILSETSKRHRPHRLEDTDPSKQHSSSFYPVGLTVLNSNPRATQSHPPQQISLMCITYYNTMNTSWILYSRTNLTLLKAGKHNKNLWINNPEIYGTKFHKIFWTMSIKKILRWGGEGGNSNVHCVTKGPVLRGYRASWERRVVHY